MSVELIPLGDKSYAVCIGKVSHHSGREYPWFASRGGVCQYFQTEHEAVQFVKGGR